MSDEHIKPSLHDTCVQTTEQFDSALTARFQNLEAQFNALKLNHNQLIELSDTAASMMSQDSLATLLQFIADEIVRLTNANGAYLHMVHETGDCLQVIAACGTLKEQLMGNTRIRGTGLSAQAWETGEVQYTDNYNSEWSAVVVFPEELKAVAVPLLFSGRLAGVAFVTASIAEDLHSQIPLLKEFAKVASLSIYYTEQLEAQAYELQRIKALSELGIVLYQTNDWHTILRNLCRHLFDIFDIDRVTVYQKSENDGDIYTHGARRNEDGSIVAHQPKTETLEESCIGHWCFDNAQLAQIDRNVEDERESERVHTFRRKNNIGCTMCIPFGDTDRPWGVVVISKHIDKRNFDESDANAYQAVASQVSTALQRNDLQSKVHHHAYHDSLTDLPNRRSFEKHFSECTKLNADTKYAVLFCDLDGFKAVNDSYGHSVGDKVITICSARMENCIGNGDYLARMGGDEFVVMVNLNDYENQLSTLARNIANTICEPIHANNLRIQIGVSIGISFYPKDGTSFSELLNHADIAMYQAKHSGKGKIQHFNERDAEEIRYKNELRNELRSALSKDEFELWYQPQVCWRSGSVVGVEALVRWNNPKRGMVSPFEFIPIAEESGLIDPLGLWIMEEAVRHLKNWNIPKSIDFTMAVNIAPPQFIDPDFSSNVLSILKKHDMDPKLLKVEITESFIMIERDAVVMHLKCLREHGVVVAIDDFGTGYSSLSYLQDLPIDVLKIDRSFVCNMTADSYETSIAASIIALATSLGLTTITEGVETDEQLEFVKKLGSPIIQGYYYSKPVPAAELLATIRDIEQMKHIESGAA